MENSSVFIGKINVRLRVRHKVAYLNESEISLIDEVGIMSRFDNRQVFVKYYISDVEKRFEEVTDTDFICHSGLLRCELTVDPYHYEHSDILDSVHMSINNQLDLHEIFAENNGKYLIMSITLDTEKETQIKMDYYYNRAYDLYNEFESCADYLRIKPNELISKIKKDKKLRSINKKK